MSKRVVLVTGAMGGIGSAICKSFYNNGDQVIAAYHPEFDDKEAWLKEMAEEGITDPVCVSGDISKFDECQKLVEEAESKCNQIDILVNCAGITRDKFFAKMEVGQWDAVISTNLSSLFNMTKQVTAKMAERGWGRVINISSVNGLKGQAGQTNYSAAKAGVIGFTKALAQEVVSKGITVNAVAPGYVATKMVMAIREDVLNSIIEQIPMKRLAKPEEVGGVCVYLASDIAGYITGSTISINGGLYFH